MLDGIHTRLGRVVYDREPSRFTAKDLLRIFKKTAGEAFADANCEYFVELAELSSSIIDVLLSAALGCELRDQLEGLRDQLAQGLRKMDFSGGEFGGGGATRDVPKNGVVNSGGEE